MKSLKINIKRYIAIILCFLMTLTLCPTMTFAEEGGDSVYTINLSASDNNVTAENEFSVNVVIDNADENAVYDYAQLEIGYNAELAEYKSASDDSGVEVTEKSSGKLLLTAYGQNKKAGNTLCTLTFKALKAGTVEFNVADGAAAGKGESVTQIQAAAGNSASVVISENGGTSGDTTPDISWYDASKSEYSIKNAQELKGLSDLVKEGVDFSGKTVTLTSNIDLSDYENWQPIGTNEAAVNGESVIITGKNAFAGTFDGKNHTISGLNCDIKAGGAALFGYSTGTIKNFTLKGSVSGSTCIAGVLALGSGTFENITNESTVTVTGNYAGGIVGDASGDITITNCHNKGIVTNGGISAEKSTGRIAGIIGRVETGIDAHIEKCSNTGEITGYQYVAGIIGGSFGNSEIQSCYNTGTITGISFGQVYIGGIAGTLQGGTIDSCYNAGTIQNRPWASGHVRGVGGIAGNEFNRADGTTAITNCYNAGAIDIDTSKMSNKYIYMTANISGGNYKTYENTMIYKNCFYLENKLTVGNPELWSDVYKANNLAYETTYTTKCTDAELQSDAVLAALNAENQFKKAESGDYKYPILRWQDGSPEIPTTVKYDITKSVSGGTADLTVNESAAKFDNVEFTVSNIESGKQIKSVRVVDASGADIEVTKSDAGKYSFTMPGRTVKITVVLENIISDDAASYKVVLPEGLDAIWNISAESKYYDKTSGTAKAGASVSVIVSKEQGAATTTFTGVDVKDKDGNAVTVSASDVKGTGDSIYYGEYTFTMPESEVTVALNVKYSDFTVNQTKDNNTTTLKTYSRDDMLTLAGTRADRVYISGWSTETVPFIGIAEKYVTLDTLLSDAGIKFEQGDKLKFTAADGFALTYGYDELAATGRYYYSDILTNKTAASQKTAVKPVITITANTVFNANDDILTIQCDTLNTYRLYYGQSEDELKNCTKIVDALPKSLVALTLIKASSSSDSGSGGGGAGGGTDEPDTSDLDLTSRSWDGKTVDVSWYFGNESDDSYTISTAAELAGLAALVNGLVNSDCKVYTGDDVMSAAKWNKSKYVNSDTASSVGENNDATAAYSYGIETFKDKTIELRSNLDMSGGNYMPIGGQYLMKKNDSSTKISASFCGMFDGGGHFVNIECDRKATHYGDGQAVGFIGRLGVHDNDDSSLKPSGAGVCDLGVTGSVTANRSVGGVVGKIGRTNGGATIERCTNKADITGTDAKGTGGICGAAWNGGTIEDCYNTGDIKNTHNAVGGIAGSNEVKIVNCYSVGKISGVAKTAAIASSNGNDSYENCYWLTGSATMGVYNKTLSSVVEMSSEDMKKNDFVDALGGSFNYNEGGYPLLKWEGGSSTSGGAAGGVVDPDQSGTVNPEDPSSGTAAGYIDVASNAWYAEAVDYVTEKGLMNGTGNQKFSPLNDTTRGQIMTILARMSGVDTSGSSPWYQKGLDWAVSKNVSDGTHPEKIITREQLATMLYRYAGSMGYDVQHSNSAASGFTDSNKVSAYASEAMAWAVDKQLITGVKSGNVVELKPQGSATRAQLATILMRWDKMIKAETAADTGTDTSK